MRRAYVNAGLGALELYANVMGGRGRSRNAASMSSGRTSGS